MNSTTWIDDCTHDSEITVRSDGELSVIGVEGKDAAISLRRRLVRQGIVCSFPMPTWEGARHEFHAKRPRGLSNSELRKLVIELNEMEQESALQTTT